MQDVFSGVQGVAESEKLPVLAAINKCGFHMWPGSTLNVGTCGNVDWVPKRLKNMWNILVGPYMSGNVKCVAECRMTHGTSGGDGRAEFVGHSVV